MNLSDKAKAVCRQYYNCYKAPGCDKCPIQQECHGKRYPNIENWITEINQAAERNG